MAWRNDFYRLQLIKYMCGEGRATLQITRVADESDKLAGDLRKGLLATAPRFAPAPIIGDLPQQSANKPLRI
jgi:hypothetical protein